MTDFRALCAELLDWAEVTAAHYIQLPAVMLRARAALADEPASVTEQPTVMQIIELSDEIEAAGLGQVDFARAVLARWGTPNLAETRSSLGDAPQPVPVSERLPGPEDCDEEGRCWVWWKNGVRWVLDEWTHHELRGGLLSDCVSHWLPFHALPLPTAND